MPFFSPIWSRTAHVTWLHHVHAEMWRMTLPPRLAAFGNFIESRLAPPLYRRTPIVTLSESSKDEIVHDLHFRPELVTVVPPGVDPAYTPGGAKSETPLVVAAGRLVPVKRFDMLIDSLVTLKARHPRLQAVIIGEGYSRPDLEGRVRDAQADDWISLPGRVGEEEKLDLYRKAWLLAMTSAREGWGMIITEAAACGTPAVATRVSGFVDAIVDGSTGLLADDRDDLTRALDVVLSDPELRARLSRAALENSARYTWGAAALGTLEVLAAAALARRRAQG
jgi:glycosyltransferase involved in cell wall biosynthesis